MQLHLDNAAPVLTACAFAVLLLAPAGKPGKWARYITGGAWAILAILLVLKSLSVSA